MRRKLIAVFVLIVTGTFALSIRDEVPRWRMGGADAIHQAPLPAVGAFPLAMTTSKTIIFMGDSNTAGTRIGGQNHAYPALLTVPNRMGVPIDNRAIGGAVVPQASQARHAFFSAQLIVIMLGTNDAAPRSHLGRRTPVPLDDFRFRLTALVRNAMHQGAKVLILAAPPAGSVAMDGRIAPYRHAARDVAIETGAHFHDPAAAVGVPDGRQRESAAFLLYDGLHVSAAGQARLAKWLDQQFLAR